VDVVMSIDRDFGRGDAWPDFVSVEVMDPVLMIVGDVNGARRHVVGAGLVPLEQPEIDNDDNDVDYDRPEMISSPGVLWAELPDIRYCASWARDGATIVTNERMTRGGLPPDVASTRRLTPSLSV
jgi:hypothetical protein